MNLLKSLFHFLGGVRFAIALIAIAAITVIAGTFVESHTGSHLLAARWTYENAFFFFLLALFFVNILFAALRRWPFKRKHIPFLMTHLGLLMIIGGTMMKNRWGLQGQFTVWEGSGNQYLLLPHTYSLWIEKNGSFPLQKSTIVLDSFRSKIYYPFHFPQLKCKLIGYAPHVKQKLESWIKGSHAHIAGFPSIPVHEWNPSQPFPKANSYHFSLTTNFPAWSILALRTSHAQEALQQAYLQELVLKLNRKGNAHESLSIPLQQALQEDVSFAGGKLKVTIDPSSFSLEDSSTPYLNLTWTSEEHSKGEKCTLALQGQDALLIKPEPTSWSDPSLIADLVRPHPLLCFIEDEEGNTLFAAFDSHGRIHTENFSSSQLETLIAYDQGFQGYGVQAVVPIPSFSAGREDKEKAAAYELTMQLKQALVHNPTLSPPLRFFEHACQQAQVAFADAFVQFLVEWNAHPRFLYDSSTPIPEPLNSVMSHLNWQSLSNSDKQAIQWVYRLLNQLDDSWKQGNHPLQTLEKHQWPLIEQLRQAQIQSGNDSPVNGFAQQIASLIHYLPAIHFPISLSQQEMKAFISAYFRIYGIDYRSLFPSRGNGKENFDHLENYWKSQGTSAYLKQTITFETPLSHRLIPDSSPPKLEDQHPGIVLEIQEGEHQQKIALAYDPSAGGLKWPILNGNYLIRFQPIFKELPYRIRLRQARQIAYPQSQQVYSYESDVLISENGKPPIEQTLSMNRVHETWDGYRFYLSGIGTSFDSSLKRIQLAVNYDPAKYLLTYPGAFLVFLGIVLLFWAKRKF